MNLIPCNFDCIYQTDGECHLKRAMSVGTKQRNDCANYVKKIKEPKYHR